MRVPETRYLKTADGVYIAYQVAGEGPVDVAIEFNADEGNVDLMWDEPDWRPFMTGIAEFARMILHDRRGTGVSSRNVPPPNLETRVADLHALLDEVGSTRPILVAANTAGAMHALFAATHPERTSAIVWNNPRVRYAWAPDYPWGDGPDRFAESMREAQYWGTEQYGRDIADWRAAERAGVRQGEVTATDADADRLRMYAKINRNTASPDVAVALYRIEWDTDVRGVLSSVQAPVALVVGSADEMEEEAQHIASLMPHATVHVVPGRSGAEADAFLGILRDVAGVRRRPVAVDSVLATVLFTDIVDSANRQASLGDRAWRELMTAHHAIVRDSLSNWRGTENDTAGDGFFASFDGPARAIRCALEISERVSELGIEIRAGLHTGECELIDGKHGGLAVSIGARIAAQAGASETLISQTVKDLVAGSGFTFADAGEHVLKGIPDRWRLYRVTG